MTQFEQELKQSQLFRAYCAENELLIQGLMNNGFELNKEYYDKACKRIKLEMAQPTLF